MGVVNATPDSFFDGGRFATVPAAVDHALRLVSEGADLVDVGGESTRPGAREVSAAEELCRVVPVLESLRGRVKVPISIDTRKPQVAEAAIRAGADLVNDVEGLGSPAMREVVRREGVAAVIMHMRGAPKDMQQDTRYDDVVGEVRDFLRQQALAAEHMGIPHDQLVIDPGIGFGKSVEGNLELLRSLPELRSLGYPLMVGASRKSFLGALLGGVPTEQRLGASVAAALAASLGGADIVRVHDVAPTVEALKVADAVRSGASRGRPVPSDP